MAKHLFEQGHMGRVGYVGEVVQETPGSYVLKTGPNAKHTIRVMKRALRRSVVVSLSGEALGALLQRLHDGDAAHGVFVHEAAEALKRTVAERSDGAFKMINEAESNERMKA